MSHELLYTSAQQGLKPGSYGFCTVLATDGLTKVLQDRLESLSGYEHAFSLTDRSTQLNPVNYSHLIVTVANQRVHLLSRIADAGADYSGRSNKLAHHVALSPNEVTAAGPAWSLASPGFCKTAFDGTPQWLPHGVLPSPNPRPFAACTAWKSVCNDAGWAGVLAELTLKNPTRPITVIYAPGIDVLPLVVEAMSLLPSDRQWRTTFSTFFTKLPAGIECQWRFVLDGTPAADVARRNLQSPPITLASPGPVPFAGPLVEAARTGRFPLATSPTTVSAPATAPPAIRAATVTTQVRGTVPDDSSETYRLGAMPTRYRASDFPRPADESPFGKQRSSRLILISGIVGGVAVLAVAVAGIYFGTRTTGSTVVQEEKGSATPEPIIEKPPALVKLDTAKATPKVAPVINTNTVAIATTKPVEAMPTEVKPEEPLLPAFDSIKKMGGILSLPKLEGGLQAAAGSAPHELCKVYLKNLSDCELKLSTTEAINGEPRLLLVPDPEPQPGTRSWSVMSRTVKDAFGESQAKPIGRFVLHDGTQAHALTFAWDTNAPDWSDPFGLLYCKLDVQVGSEKVACGLSKPIITPAEKLDLTRRRQLLAIGIPARSLSSTEFLRYDIELHLGDWSEGAYRVNTSTLTKIVIPNESAHGDGKVELEFRFTPPGKLKGAELAYAAFIFPTSIIPPTTPVQPPEIPQWKRETKRSDLIDKALKDGFVRPDFENARRLGARQTPNALEGILFWEDKIKSARKNFTGDELENELRYRRGMKRYFEDAVDHGKKFFDWTNGMNQRFGEIEQKLEVRYSVYLDYGNPPVVLAETNPPPKRPESKASIKEEKASNQEGKVDDKAKSSIVPF